MYKPWKQLNREISGYYYSSLIQIPVIYIQCYYMYSVYYIYTVLLHITKADVMKPLTLSL